MNFETVQAIATAAEKYRMFSAMYIPQIPLRYALHDLDLRMV